MGDVIAMGDIVAMDDAVVMGDIVAMSNIVTTASIGGRQKRSNQRFASAEERSGTRRGKGRWFGLSTPLKNVVL